MCQSNLFVINHLDIHTELNLTDQQSQRSLIKKKLTTHTINCRFATRFERDERFHSHFICTPSCCGTNDNNNSDTLHNDEHATTAETPTCLTWNGRYVTPGAEKERNASRRRRRSAAVWLSINRPPIGRPLDTRCSTPLDSAGRTLSDAHKGMRSFLFKSPPFVTEPPLFHAFLSTSCGPKKSLTWEKKIKGNGIFVPLNFLKYRIFPIRLFR